MIDKKNGFKIEYTKGDTYALKITFKNVNEDLTTAFFTVKENADDTTPIIQKTIGSGIIKIDDNLYKNQLVYKLQLQAEDSRDLQPNFQYLYDLKVALGNVIKTVISGNFIVNDNITSVDSITTALADIEVDALIESNAETTPATMGIEYEQDPVARLLIGDMDLLNTTAKSTLVDAINEANTKASAGLEEVTKIEDGTVSVPEATHATSADNATNATNADNATNATKINNLEIVQDQNGILKIGNIIIPQKQELWSGSTLITASGIWIDNLNIQNGDKIEITIKDYANYYIKGYFEITNNGGSCMVNLTDTTDTATSAIEIISCRISYGYHNVDGVNVYGIHCDMPRIATYNSNSGTWAFSNYEYLNIIKILKIIE